ncbi:class I SAM-dependent methyltransferase [uncultured Ferrovibrio sp.]|jgi:hypothetical protein|uniref:class I SAM-dependent methyltransferase n=1 Tax=uncultured Ferrovibrio sp. TaxID=1576913 RepID=UPI002621832C|nr:class I SAM-dependent methyltransferase [uncultured Ferrovibrio sp.]
MSRLESHIRRLQAQCELLNWATSIQESRNSVALDLGLGNGRTYNHLCERLPGWRVVAFDRQNAADPKSLGPKSEVVLGEFQVTLPEFAARYPRSARIIHSDAGLSDPSANARQMQMLGAVMPELAADGAIILSDQELAHPLLQRIHPPVAVPVGRYFAYERITASLGLRRARRSALVTAHGGGYAPEFA